jgi:hypothetical protein
MLRMLYLAGLPLSVLLAVAIQLGCRGASTPASPLVVSPAQLDFGSVPVGTRAQQALVLTNPGAASVRVRDISVEPPFAVTGNSFALGPGESTQLAVLFAADDSGPAEGRVRIEMDVGGAPSASVTVKAVAYRPAEIAIDPLGLSFGEVELGKESRAQIVAGNLGDEDLLLEGIAASGPFAVEESATVVSPASEATLEISFAPKQVGRQEASLVVRTNDPKRKRLAVNLRGIGVDRPPLPAVEVDSLVLDFGSVSSCLPRAQRLPIHNAGSDPLTIASVTIARPFGAPRGSRRVPPGATLELPVSFSPLETGPAVSPLVLHTNDPEAPVVVVSLMGEGEVEKDCLRAGTPESEDDESRAPFDIAAVGGGGGVTVVVPDDRAGEPHRPGDPDVGPDGDGEPGPPPPPPLVREGSLVSLGTYRGEIGPAHVDGVTLLPASGQLALQGVQLPNVELPFDQFFEFERIDVVGEVSNLGDVEMQLPVEMLDQDGNRSVVPLTLTTGASATVTSDGTVVTLQGEPLGPDGNVSLVGTVTLPDGGLQGLAMGVVLNVRVSP